MLKRKPGDPSNHGKNKASRIENIDENQSTSSSEGLSNPDIDDVETLSSDSSTSSPEPPASSPFKPLTAPEDIFNILQNSKLGSSARECVINPNVQLHPNAKYFTGIVGNSWAMSCRRLLIKEFRCKLVMLAKGPNVKSEELLRISLTKLQDTFEREQNRLIQLEKLDKSLKYYTIITDENRKEINNSITHCKSNIKVLKRRLSNRKSHCR